MEDDEPVDIATPSHNSPPQPPASIARLIQQKEHLIALRLLVFRSAFMLFCTLLPMADVPQQMQHTRHLSVSLATRLINQDIHPVRLWASVIALLRRSLPFTILSPLPIVHPQALANLSEKAYEIHGILIENGVLDLSNEWLTTLDDAETS